MGLAAGGLYSCPATGETGLPAGIHWKNVAGLFGQVTGALHLTLYLFGLRAVLLQTYHCVVLIGIPLRSVISTGGCCCFQGSEATCTLLPLSTKRSRISTLLPSPGDIILNTNASNPDTDKRKINNFLYSQFKIYQHMCLTGSDSTLHYSTTFTFGIYKQFLQAFVFRPSYLIFVCFTKPSLWGLHLPVF